MGGVGVGLLFMPWLRLGDYRNIYFQLILLFLAFDEDDKHLSGTWEKHIRGHSD